MAIKCVFFDFDGVLRIWEYEEERFAEWYGIPIETIREVAFDPSWLHPVVRGQITNEEWRARTADELKNRFNTDQVERAMADWNSRNGQLIPEMIYLARECREKTEIALFSNATTRLRWELEQHGLSDFFDHVVNASETGYMKPEPEIYHRALEIAGVSANEAFFTDDKLEHAQVATSLGWTGHHFKNAEGLRAALVEAGVLT